MTKVEYLSMLLLGHNQKDKRFHTISLAVSIANKISFCLFIYFRMRINISEHIYFVASGLPSFFTVLIRFT